MTTRTRLAIGALTSLCAIASLFPAAGSATVTAHLRVLTPDRVLDPGTTYIVDQGVTVPTRADADCFGPPGGSGTAYSYEKPNALSLLATAGRTTEAVSPLLLTDQFGFGLGICGVGGFEAQAGESFWYFKSNHQESTIGADQVEIEDGDGILFYLAPDNYPEPNPAELQLKAPAAATAGEPFNVKVVEHACVTDQDTFETTCASGPADGATVTAEEGEAGSKGDDDTATTGANGKAQVTVDDLGEVTVTATRGNDIPSEALETCVGSDADACPRERGIELVGSPQDDRIKGTAGHDEIRSRGGDDKVDLREGGADTVNCGRGNDTVRVPRKSADGAARKVRPNCERIKRK